MQFRYRGNSVQVSKMKDDPATGKPVRIQLGSINKQSLKLSEKLQASCSEQERKEITSWIKNQKKLDNLKSELAAKTLANQIGKAGEWLAQADKKDAGPVANDIMSNWSRLRGILKKNNLI